MTIFHILYFTFLTIFFIYIFHIFHSLLIYTWLCCVPCIWIIFSSYLHLYRWSISDTPSNCIIAKNNENVNERSSRRSYTHQWENIPLCRLKWSYHHTDWKSGIYFQNLYREHTGQINRLPVCVFSSFSFSCMSSLNNFRENWKQGVTCCSMMD